MVNPTLYKKINAAELQNRNTFSATDLEKSSIDSTINKFFSLFKEKHL